MINRFLRTISILLVICLLIIPSINNVYATESFTSVFGGGDNGKQALAFMTVMTGLGVTFVNQSDAVALFNEFKEKAPLVLSDMVDVVKESWIGSYSSVTSKLISVKNSVYDYLQSIYGNLTSGINVTSSNIINDSSYKPLNIDYFRGGSLTFEKNIVTNINGYLYFCKIVLSSNSLSFYDYDGDLFRNYSITNDITYSIYLNQNSVYYSVKPDSGSSGTYHLLSLITDSLIVNSTIEDTSISVNISSDAGVLEGEFEPNEDEPLILPPPFIPGLNLKEKTLPNGSISHEYDGTVDDYLQQAADNNTYSDVETYLQTGSNTTTLTQTDTGLAVGEVSDVPFPDTNIDTPTDVLTGIGTIGGLIQGLTNWLSNIVNAIKDIFAVPTDLTLNFDSLRLVDFKNKFPFSIPWDLYRAISAFAKSPTTPNMAIDLETEYFQVYQPIDLNSISFPLAFARYSAVVFFIMFLIGKTRDLIKW